MTVSTYWCERALVDGDVHESVTVAVADGRFTSVAAGQPAPPGSTRLRGVVIPGLANAHSHAFHRALRSRTQARSGTFWTWRNEMYTAAHRLGPDSYHRLARATFAEMALAGIAAVGEFHYLHHQPDGTPYDDPNAMGEALLMAAAEAGIRITLLDALYLHGGLEGSGYVPLEGVQARFGDRSAVSWAERVDRLRAAPGGRIGAAIHSVRAVDPASMRVVVEWADLVSAPVHAHVSEQRSENERCLAHHESSPTALLGEAGALGPRFSAVHATHATDRDAKALASTGSVVCLCPTTERDLGDGIGPTALLADAGVPMTVGSDSHAVIDLFEEARAVELDERLQAERRGAHSPTELLTMATSNGHASLGWPDAGAIAPGNRADLVAVRLDSVRTAGATTETAKEAVVFAATAADVTDVDVEGRPIVADGRHLTIDVAAELAAAVAAITER